MTTEATKFGNLTHNGLMLLRRMGNGQPTLSQMEFAQSIISLLSMDEDINNNFNKLLANDCQTRESIRRDNLHYRNFFATESIVG
jgi:hypothetical protein